MGNRIDWFAFVLIQLFGLFNQLYIVYSNDYADYDDDKKNSMPTMFSGGSRVLVDNLLHPKDLKTAGLIMAFLCLACALIFTLLYKYFYMIPLVIFALLLLWLYSFKPVRLSYRGGGEILQTLGTALVLPLLGFYAQSGSIVSFPWKILLAIVPTSFACAVATAVPDAPADAAYNKNTVPVAIGLNRAKALIIVLNVISIILYYLLTEPFKNSLLSVFLLF